MSDLTKFSAVVDLGAPQIVEARNLIVGFEMSMRKIEGHMEGDCFPLKHIFTPGIYAREITLPVGAILVGKIHREQHLNFISRGRVQVFTESGGLEELEGPCTMVSDPGTKRTVHVLEETVWTTIHHNPDNHTDLEKLEEIVIAPTFEHFDMKELT
jgi:hypothetical protein